MERDLTKFIFNYTVGEFIDLLRELFPQLNTTTTQKEDGPTFTGRILYNGRDVENFFHISHKTASQWVNGWMAPAVKRQGCRKYIVDAEYALKLYDRRKSDKNEDEQ